jgi:hypothetical protein
MSLRNADSSERGIEESEEIMAAVFSRQTCRVRLWTEDNRRTCRRCRVSHMICKIISAGRSVNLAMVMTPSGVLQHDDIDL